MEYMVIYDFTINRKLVYVKESVVECWTLAFTTFTTKTIGIIIDLARTFDNVDHRILLHMGIRGFAYTLVESNLTQYFKYGVWSRDECSIGYTVLGSILFSIYLTDLISILPADCSEWVCGYSGNEWVLE